MSENQILLEHLVITISAIFVPFFLYHQVFDNSTINICRSPFYKLGRS